MGFGHRVYKVEDPRATHLRAMAAELAAASGDDTYYRMSRRIEETVLAEKGLYPNVDFFAATVYHYLGIPTDLFTPVFSVSRMAGWTAHVIEQHADNRLIRPDSEYIGEVRPDLGSAGGAMTHASHEQADRRDRPGGGGAGRHGGRRRRPVRTAGRPAGQPSGQPGGAAEVGTGGPGGAGEIPAIAVFAGARRGSCRAGGNLAAASTSSRAVRWYSQASCSLPPWPGSSCLTGGRACCRRDGGFLM